MATNGAAHSETERVNAALENIARMLDCSVKHFFDQSPSDLRQTAELLDLWIEIESPQDRAKALAYVRNVSSKVQALGAAGRHNPGEPVALAHAMQKLGREP